MNKGVGVLDGRPDKNWIGTGTETGKDGGRGELVAEVVMIF